MTMGYIIKLGIIMLFGAGLALFVTVKMNAKLEQEKRHLEDEWSSD